MPAATLGDPQTSNPRLPLAIASAATFLAFLDVTIVNVAFADLRVSFAGASLSELSWTVTGYALVFAAFLAPVGRLADSLGRVRVFAAGLGVFGLASAGAALAPGIGWLVGARLLQGGGAAAMIPAALSIVLAASPPQRRLRAVGAWAAAGSLAAAAGPVLGGVLVDALGWRAAFWVNVPLAAVLLLAARGLRGGRGGGTSRVDVLGLALIGAGVGSLVGGLAQAGEWGWLDLRTVILLAVGLALTVVAAGRASRSANPAFAVGLLRVPALGLAAAGSFFIGATLFAWLLFGVLFLTRVWGYSVLEAGLASGPGSLFSVVGSVVASRLAARVPAGTLIVVGGVLQGLVAAFLAVSVDPAAQFLTVWLPAGAVSGIGIAFMIVGASGAAAVATPPAEFAAGTGLMIAARQLGGAIGVSLTASMLTLAAVPLDGFRLVFATCGAWAVPAALVGLVLARREVADKVAAR